MLSKWTHKGVEMGFDTKLFLALIEEDNEQRALFRVRPLLHEQGAFLSEELEALGDEGCLRIVPDKQEQHSFKERMRSLGTLCLIDLRPYDPEVNKIRQNKNYAPQRGENNRFVLYSDAVHELPAEGFYEVVSDPKAQQPLTSSYYLRHGGNIRGPYAREDGQPGGELNSLAPDSERLFALSLPGQRDRLLFWPLSEAKSEEAPEPPSPAEPLTSIERIRLLAAETQPKLVATPEPVPEPEAPPGLPGGRLRGTPLKRVALRPKPPARAAQEQATPLQERLHAQQLQAMEAERLALLMELDRLRGDKQALLKEALLEQGEAKEAAALEAEALEQRVALLRAELEGLMERRPADQALTVKPAEPCGIDLAAKRIKEALCKAGFGADKDGAMHFLLLCLSLPAFRLNAPYAVDARLAAQALASALGIHDLSADARGQDGCDAFAFQLADARGDAVAGLPRIVPGSLLKPEVSKREQRELRPLPELCFIPEEGFGFEPLPLGKPVQLSGLERELRESRRELPEAAMSLLEQLAKALEAQGKPLPLSLKRQLIDFLCAAQTLFEGGLPVALDRGIAGFVLPFVRLHGLEGKALLPLLAEMPRCRALL